MNIHVICCNDSVEFAVIENLDKAKKKMADLSTEYYERNKWTFNQDADTYKRRCQWSINTVDGEA